MYLSRAGFESDKSTTAKSQAPPSTVDRGRLQGSVARQFVSDFVDLFSGVLVEGDNAAPVAIDISVTGIQLWAARRTATDHADQQITFDDRGTPYPEEILYHTLLFHGVDIPDGFSVIGAQAVQHTFRSVDVDTIAFDDG